ncbi:MAG: AAA family ATPase, partial [Campylobacter sp.]|nr:AAA family ATPase [Campylobacter sp.]
MNLALKFRPKKLNQILGQRHIIEVFAKFIENKTIPHSIFFGNAGSGKTTLAKVV